MIVSKASNSDTTIDTPASSPAAPDPVPLAPIARLLLTPIEAAAALRISPRLLWSKTKIGEIPCVRIGKAVRYAPAALQAFIDRATPET
jgi:Helix-turn-helix domain